MAIKRKERTVLSSRDILTPKFTGIFNEEDRFSSVVNHVANATQQYRIALADYRVINQVSTFGADHQVINEAIDRQADHRVIKKGRIR